MTESLNIIRGLPEHASRLTEITLAAKRHWGYPEKWIQLWIPQLTISPEYILENEVWMAVADNTTVAYYSLKLQPVTPALACGASVARARLFFARSNPSPYWGLLRREKHPPRNDGDNLWLDNLWVLPEFIGQGIGKQLFHHAIERVRTRNFFVLNIEADPNAQSFYEKMGARKVSECRHAEMDGQARRLPVMQMNL